ncbi:TPA: hypothetical protein LSH14_003887 [Escherichia coli]|nr:hypothetical protein [Escherichia coli]HBL6864404.1 hypothetical protein [Escherichia coli]HCX4621862.1 hypothetical protein [Escherichia coli]
MRSKEEIIPNQNNTGRIKKRLDELADMSEFMPGIPFLLLMIIFMIAGFACIFTENMLWQLHKNEHQCRVTEIRSGQSAWTCNDGSVRWRTSTPDDQRYLWEKFKADHACRLIESRDRDNNGPARDAWICDDGAVYWKNRLPG